CTRGWSAYWYFDLW
nr:immunoglobulin heavy chain junction region [Macaca mulatta]MOW98088.1 immunoglobulin heavy chain junction region [Macaca mulatta]MOW98185.1 immunoglobulin heavy chain junction region [Macaca mulatta]MOW98401.1 immunoglobulin heavy chain junction region [Macaca mulatta]MOW98579.1 immunoglobulin heavy chain junction region [Macaca mulatta]